MNILALIGPAGSGKTTLANLLSNCGWKQTKFANPIKHMISELLRYQGLDLNIVKRMIDGDLKETPTKYLNDQTPRHAMQTLGTEWRDLIDRNLWVDMWKRNILNYPQDSKIIVDDCRFAHEAHMVRRLDGKLIFISRPNNPNSIQSSRSSETEMKSIIYDAIIKNDSAPEHMLDEFKSIMEYWK